MHRAFHLLQNLHRRMVFMDERIVWIGKLLGHKDSGIFLLHAERCFQALINTFSDISVIVYQYHFRPVLLYQLPALFTDIIFTV